jgi:hypothetical protein
MDLGGELQHMITHKPCLGSMNQQFHWTPGTEFQLGGPLFYDFLPLKSFVRGSLELGFFLMRHNANPIQGVDFHNPCVGRFWAPCSHGCWPYGPFGAYETQLRRPIVILCPQPNFHCLPEWIHEASCNLT